MGAVEQERDAAAATLTGPVSSTVAPAVPLWPEGINLSAGSLRIYGCQLRYARLHVREEARSAVFAPPFHFCLEKATKVVRRSDDPLTSRTRVG